MFKSYRKIVANQMKVGSVEAARLKCGSSLEFGDQLANYLERNPHEALDIVNQRVYAYQYLAHLGAIVKQFKINFVIDAGAHSGQFASTLYGYGGFFGSIHSFEPVKQYFDILKTHVDYYPGWVAHNLALGNVSGPATIYVGGGHGGTSSLLNQTDNLKNFAPDCQLGPGETIEVRRIDQIFSNELCDQGNRVMLKLDVQGFEERVLESAGDYVQSFKLVQIEVSGIPLYESQASLGDLCKKFETLGYALIYTCNSFGVNKSIFIDYDFIFCRKDELENVNNKLSSHNV